MIDVHILLMGNENKLLFEKCIGSLSGEPISLHLCEGIAGDLQTARKNAISKGTNEYIGWVDPDDEIVPGIYSKLLSYTPEYSFVWAKEEVRTYTTTDFSHMLDSFYRKTPHHIHIVHRDLIKPEYFEQHYRADVWTHNFMSTGKYLDEVGYIWNRYPNSNGRTHYETVINNRTTKV